MWVVVIGVPCTIRDMSGAAKASGGKQRTTEVFGDHIGKLGHFWVIDFEPRVLFTNVDTVI